MSRPQFSEQTPLPERSVTCQKICLWIQLLSEGKSCEPPRFESEYANRIVQAILGYHNTLRTEQRKTQLLDDLLTRLHEGNRVEHLLDFIFANFSDLLPFDRIGLSLLDEESPDVAEAVYMKLREGEPRLAPGYRANIRQSSLYTVLKSGQPRIISDLVEYLNQHPSSHSTKLLIEEGMRSSLTVPLHALGRAVGFLFFSSQSPDAYHEPHVLLLLKIARKLGMAIEKARIIEKLEARNAQLRRLANMVSHDLRTPLSVVTGYVSMFSEGNFGGLTDEQRNVLEKMKKACNQTQMLLDDLLDCALAEAHRLQLHKENFSLPALVDERVDHLRQQLDLRKLDIKVAFDVSLPTITADRERIGRIFDNLLSNAMKFSPSGSTVFITLTRRENDFLMGVRDTGPGLSEEQRKKLFSCFPEIRSSASRGPGRSVGLGLTIAKELVEAHGGHIWVESSPGAGATFWFTIPAA